MAHLLNRLVGQVPNLPRSLTDFDHDPLPAIFLKRLEVQQRRRCDGTRLCRLSPRMDKLQRLSHMITTSVAACDAVAWSRSRI